MTPSTGTTIHHAALAAGRRVGRYEILGVLGQGGFGITYRARDTQLGRDVAVKEYLPTALAIRQDGTTVLPRSTDVVEDFVWGRDRFIAEGHTLASLEEAPAIVRVFDFLEANGTAYIVMELLRGETLEARLSARGPLSPAEVNAILRPLLDGLEHVHTAGFLHRDIKPANILLKANGAPTLIDFGASRAAIAGRTAAMTAIFTPGYAAAEQFTSAKQGPWSDIYGLAATIHCAITGQPPPSAFDRMLDDEYRPLVRLRPAGFAPGMLAGIDAALAVRAADRPQSIAQWRAILNDTSNTTVAMSRPRPAPAAPPPPASPVMASDGRRPAALYAGAALAVVLLAIGGWFVLSPSGPQRGALQDMKVEDLERALAERRKADAETAEKRRLEEEAQRKATADALAKQAADAELERAQAERQKAEQELARIKAELEAQLKAAAARRDQAEAAAQRAAAEEAERKAQAEADARRQAEEEARRKAAAEAQAKQQADEALAKAQAERQKAEEEGRQKAEAEARQMAEATAKQKAEAEAAEAAAAKAAQQAASEAADRKAGEAAEAALKLAPADRQRLQAALTSLGFDTRGTDGAFGPRSREMIAGWQKARNQPPTGYVNATQQQALLREGAAGVGKFDDEQKKLEEKKADEARKKAEDAAKDQAKATAAAPAAGAAPAATAASVVPAATPAAGSFDGVYGGGLQQGQHNQGKVYTVTMTIAGGRATGEAVNRICGSFPIALSVSPSGDISGPFQIAEPGSNNCGRLPGQVTGRVGNGKVEFEVRAAGVVARGSLTKR